MLLSFCLSGSYAWQLRFNALPMVATLPKKDRQAPPFRAPKGGVKKNQVKGKRTARGTAPSPVVDAPIGAAIVLLVTV